MNDSNSLVLDEVSEQRFPSFIALRAKHSELLQREPETEDAKQLCIQEAEDFIKQVQATGAILSDEDERRLAQNILNYWVSALYREDQVARSVALADYDPKLTADVGDVECPYPGVCPFTEDNSPFFFGRQRQIDYMLGRLSEDRLLVIVGPSGAGKTSLVQAGLLPALKREPPNNVEHFFLKPMSPGTQPLHSLAMMIKEAHPSIADNPNWIAQQVKGFQQDPHHLLKLIEQITDKPVVIFVDQGEDLYERNMPTLLRPLENILDLDNSKITVEPFLDNLMRVIQSSNRKHIVIVARRVGDFEKHIKRLPSRVKEVFEPARVVLPALYASELADAIEKPAELLGVTFQELHHVEDSGPLTTHQTTVQALVREISSEPVGLPLLQFTLPRLWEKRVQSYIPEDAFLQIGSCQTMLADTAEQFYVSLSHYERRDCRILLKQLVNLDRELKAYIQPVRRSALYPSLRNPVRFDELIARMEQRQLVRLTKGATAGDDLVELVHESLLRNWSRMSGWITLKVWLRQQAQTVKVFGIGLLIAAIVLVGLFFIGRRDQKNKAEDLARLSAKQATYDRFDLALRLGSQAYALTPNVVTRSNLVRLLHSLQSTSRPKSFLYKPDFEVDDIVFNSPTEVDSDKLAAVDSHGNIVIWDLTTRRVVKTLASENTATYPLAFSPDGRFLATASLKEGVPLILWDLNSTDGQRRNLTYENPTGITTLAFHPNDRSLVAADAGGRVIRWNDDEVEGARLYAHEERVTTIAFNSDGTLMATGGEDGQAIVAATVRNGRRKTFRAGGEVANTARKTRSESIFSLNFRNTDNLLAAGGEDEVFIWDVDTGEEVTKFNTGPSRAGVLASFSSDGELLTAFSFGGALVSWDLASEQTVGKQFYNPAATYSAAFSKHGRMLALPSEDGVVLWEVSDQAMLQGGSMVPVSNTVHSLAFSPNRERQILASLGHDGSLTVWHPGTKNEAVGSQVQSNVSKFAFNADGSTIALALRDGTISLRDINDYREIKTLDVAARKVVVREAELPAESEEIGDAQREGDALSISRLVASSGRTSTWLAALVVKTSGETTETKILLWNTNEASAIEVASGSDSVTALALSPDGRTIAWGSFDTQTRRANVVVSVPGQQPKILSCSENGGCADKVSSLAFSEKGKLAAGLDNGQIILWDSSHNGKAANPMQGAIGVVTDLAFGLDEAVLAAVTNKNVAHPPPGTITLWDVETREPIGNLLRGHEGNVSTIAFSADGKTLASASDAHGDYIILWDLDVEHADKRRFCGIVGCDEEREEIAAQIKETTWPQLVYQTLTGWYEKLLQTRLMRRFNS